MTKQLVHQSMFLTNHAQKNYVGHRDRAMSRAEKKLFNMRTDICMDTHNTVVGLINSHKTRVQRKSEPQLNYNKKKVNLNKENLNIAAGT